jgi:Tol biopolymer transport system component
MWFIVSLLMLTALTACGSLLTAERLPEVEQVAAMPSLAPTEVAAQVQPTPTAVPASPTPAPVETPTATPTPAPSLWQLTEGGCCVQPFFSPDSRQVLFIDKPAPEAPVGVYGVDLADPQGAVTLVDEVVGFRNLDRSMVATLEGKLAHFVNETTGENWAIDTGGNWPYYSPDSRKIVWVAADQLGPFDQRQSDIWLANLDGSEARQLFSLYGGGFSGWFPDGQRLLLIGRDQPWEESQTLLIYDLTQNRRTNLASHKRIRGLEMSPEGSWVVYFISFADPPEERGVWVAATDGLTRKKLTTPGFGAYHWRDDQTLLYIPMRLSAEASMQLFSINVATNQIEPLTDPQTVFFSISNGDWRVSPNGQHVVFVNSLDQNIWLLSLP